jgi:23S rRNA (uracil1939-C5)-methyltransferase
MTALRARARSACARLPALRPARRGLRRLQDAAPAPGAQVAVKQRVLEDNLWHLAKVQARAAAAADRRPGLGLPLPGAAVGALRGQEGRRCWSAFHERKSRYVADMRSARCCRRTSAPAAAAARADRRMDQRDRLPQIELAMGDAVTALVLRHLEPLSGRPAEPAARLCRRARRAVVAAAQGPGHRAPLDEGGPNWPTRCPSSASPCPSSPPTSRRSTRTSTACWWARAAACWTCRPDERVIDWFCGLGNFTLPLATRRARCWASRAARPWWRARATTRGQRPGRTRRPVRGAQPVRDDRRRSGAYGPADKLAGRPAARRRLRAGQGPGRPARHRPALGAAAGASSTSAATRPRWRATPACWCTRPATAARAAGVVNMFPHTAHVESMAVFDRGHEKGAPKGPSRISRGRPGVSRVAAEDAQQRQQALEHVVDAQVDAQRGGDVVGLAAVDARA